MTTALFEDLRLPFPRALSAKLLDGRNDRRRCRIIHISELAVERDRHLERLGVADAHLIRTLKSGKINAGAQFAFQATQICGDERCVTHEITQITTLEGR
jgi:hypothetical protein